MEFTETKRASLLASMREEFASATVTLGDIYIDFANRADFPCIYVDFFVDGHRRLADVTIRADGAIDWAY